MCQGSHSLAGEKDTGLNKSYREENSPTTVLCVCVCVCVCVNLCTLKCSPENTDDRMSTKYENKKWIYFCAQDSLEIKLIRCKEQLVNYRLPVP